MSQTQKATGINLKGKPLGEADRLVTVLTAELGLVRAIVPGARKQKSRLRGRCELFVVNELLIVKGRSLDKIIQAETLESFSGLSRDLSKLAAGQYLAELVLSLALSEQPQTELYALLLEHLRRIEQLPKEESIHALLAQAVFHLLAIAGVAPQVHDCCLSNKPLIANFTDPQWQVGFSFNSGGVVHSSACDRNVPNHTSQKQVGLIARETKKHDLEVNDQLNALELTLLQQLNLNSVPQLEQILPKELVHLSVNSAWIKVEYVLRKYAQYHCGCLIRSANLVDNLYIVK